MADAAAGRAGGRMGGRAGGRRSGLVARAGGRQRDDSDHCVTPTGAKLACTFSVDLLTATEQNYRNALTPLP